MFTPDSAHADVVQLRDAAGTWVPRLAPAITEAWWDSHRQAGALRRPWLAFLYPPTILFDWPASVAIFRRPPGATRPPPTHRRRPASRGCPVGRSPCTTGPLVPYHLGRSSASAPRSRPGSPRLDPLAPLPSRLLLSRRAFLASPATVLPPLFWAAIGQFPVPKLTFRGGGFLAHTMGLGLCRGLNFAAYFIIIYYLLSH